MSYLTRCERMQTEAPRALAGLPNPGLCMDRMLHFLQRFSLNNRPRTACSEQQHTRLHKNKHDFFHPKKSPCCHPYLRVALVTDNKLSGSESVPQTPPSSLLQLLRTAAFAEWPCFLNPFALVISYTLKKQKHNYWKRNSRNTNFTVLETTVGDFLSI